MDGPAAALLDMRERDVYEVGDGARDVGALSIVLTYCYGGNQICTMPGADYDLTRMTHAFDTAHQPHRPARTILLPVIRARSSSPRTIWRTSSSSTLDCAMPPPPGHARVHHGTRYVVPIHLPVLYELITSSAVSTSVRVGAMARSARRTCTMSSLLRQHALTRRSWSGTVSSHVCTRGSFRLIGPPRP